MRKSRLLVIVGSIVCVGLALGSVPSSARTEQLAAAAAPAADFVMPVRYEVTVKTTVQKFHSDVSLGPGRLDGELNLTSGVMTGKLTMPPGRGYFLAFRFVPVTSAITLVPVGEVTAKITSGKITTTLRVDMRLSDAKVNGTRLDVGGGCKSATPLEITQTGNLGIPPSDMDVSGSFAISQFGGCGATENLDRLFTGMVSGPDNKVSTHLKFVCGTLDPKLQCKD